MSQRHGLHADESRSSYIKARNKAKRMTRQTKRCFEKEIGNSCKNNPKVFWSHVRNKLNTKSGIAPLLENINDKKSIKFDDNEKANILQQQFSSIFTQEPEEEIPSLNKRTDICVLNINVTEVMVRNEIRGLNINKSCGPEEIHPRLLQELVDIISEPIVFLMNKSMETGVIPLDWKKAYVSPIYKKGARNRAENYRPISLTCILCKLMDIKDEVMKHLKSENLLSCKQYGFISGRSTTTQLLSYLDKCIETIVTGGVVDTIYFDFAKAFDTVPHPRLLGKLSCYGISGNIINWIKAFLLGRSQVVRVNGEKSEETAVLSGIPQGSVLGPLLFVVYINDLPESVKSNIFLFADDTKILKQITSKEDALDLQSDIDSLEQWSNKWLPESAVNNPWDTIRKIGSFVRTLSLIITPGVVLGKIRTPWAYIRKSYKIVLYLPLIHVYINQKLPPSPPPPPPPPPTLSTVYFLANADILIYPLLNSSLTSHLKS